MTFTLANNPLSIFEGGKLKPGTYKIQNLSTEGYADVHEVSREVHCRLAQDIGEGRGIVRPDPLPLIHV